MNNPPAACHVAAARAKPTDLFDEKGVLLGGIGRQSGLGGKNGGNGPRVVVIREWKINAGKGHVPKAYGIQRKEEDCPPPASGYDCIGRARTGLWQ